jgi:hypothetical protein
MVVETFSPHTHLSDGFSSTFRTATTITLFFFFFLFSFFFFLFSSNYGFSFVFRVCFFISAFVGSGFGSHVDFGFVGFLGEGCSGFLVGFEGFVGLRYFRGKFECLTEASTLFWNLDFTKVLGVVGAFWPRGFDRSFYCFGF